MDINSADNKIDKVDSFLTKLKIVLKKHWGILILIGVGYFFYWVLTTDYEDVEEETTEEIYQEPYITDEYLELNEYGDTLVIEVWSDGVETVAE